MGGKEQKCQSPENWGGEYQLDNQKGSNSASVALPPLSDHFALVWLTRLWPGVALKIELSLFPASKKDENPFIKL